jgi:tetratricopeptide (TPR) repeat protein
MQKRYKEAEPLLRHIVEIYSQKSDVENSEMVHYLNDLAFLCKEQKRYKETEALLQQAKTICETKVETDYPETVTILSNLADLYMEQEKYTKADLLLQQAKVTCERYLGFEHSIAFLINKQYTRLLQLTRQNNHRTIKSSDNYIKKKRHKKS